MNKKYNSFSSKSSFRIALMTFLFSPTLTSEIKANEMEKSLHCIRSFGDEITLQRTITKNTTASQLDEIINYFKKEGVKVVFSKLKRNRDYEIIKIKALCWGCKLSFKLNLFVSSQWAINFCVADWFLMNVLKC